MKDVVVVGGGLAGLAAAQLCVRAGLDVTVIDPHQGGRAQSDVVDGFTFNRGPHALYLGMAAERVLRHLGVGWHGGPPSIAAGSMWVDGAPAPIPTNLGSVMRNPYLGLKDKASFLRLFAKVPRLVADEWSTRTVDELLDGLTDRAAKVARMAIRTSTYSASFSTMSADVAITALHSKGVRYIDGGWQTLVDQLARGIDIQPRTAIAVRDDSVELDGGELVPTRASIVAVGTPHAAAAVLGRAPFDVGAPIEAACYDLGLNVPPTQVVLMSLDEPLYFSTHSPPARLAPEGTVVAHVARYLTEHDAPANHKAALRAHADCAGVDDSAIVADRYLHRMTVCGVLPTASRGGMAGRPTVDSAGRANVYLAGDWVGPTDQLADCALASAFDAATRLIAARG